MAELAVWAVPGARLARYGLRIDGLPRGMAISRRPMAIAARLGADRYTLFGPAGGRCG